MELVRWQPLSDMVSLREAMDRLFEERFAWPAHTAMHGFETLGLPIDMYQTDEAVVVKATVPGVKPDEIDISITGDTLTIKGETKAEEKVEKENYFRRERRYGTFTRTVVLPDAVETDKAEAAFEDGVLTLTIPKAEEIKPKQIKVKPKTAIEGEKKK